VNYRFKCIEVNRHSLIVKTERVDRPGGGRDYISHWHLMGDEEFEKWLKDLEQAIRAFRRQSIREATQ